LSAARRRAWAACAAALLATAGAAATTAPPPASDAKARKPAATARPPAKGATAAKPAPAATPQRQQSLQREQQQVQAALARLKRDLAAAEASRSEASAGLAAAERAISQTNRRLRELAAGRQRVEQQLSALNRREQDALARQVEEQRRLNQWLRQQHTTTDSEPLQQLLAGGDPNQRLRDGVYLAYLSRDADAAVAQLQQRRVELAVLREESAVKAAELAKIAADEATNRAQLEREQAARKQALDRLAKQIAGQRESLAKMEADDKRLGALLDRISAILADQQRREAERQRQARGKDGSNAGKAAAQRPPSPTDSKPTAAISPPADGKFGQLKGKMNLPVAGTVTARFGATRRGEGGTGPSWKGVFIRAAAGAEVRSVGDGQVVFADWLRGFGNLIVIDHGDGFLSVYGNNEALLRNPGDRVTVGEVISSVGNTGGSETPGLYFELRFQGRPFDPLTWVASR
jgi:septal ring factor EnvC (AmiA/AmiB activator)